MRKLKFTCTKSATAYSAAAIAITEIGMTKGFKGKQTFTRSVAWAEGDLRGHAAEYDAFYHRPTETVQLTVLVDGCRWFFQFTWPELKLTSIHATSCNC